MNQEKTESPLMNSPLRLEPIINGRSTNHKLLNKNKHRSTSPSSHELLSAKSSTISKLSKPKTISFSSSLENTSLDDRENGDQPSPSIFIEDDHSPVFKSLSVNSKNLEIRKKDKLEAKSSVKIDRIAQQINNLSSFSLRKKDKNNNQEKFRKPSSSTISNVSRHGSSSNENSQFATNEQNKQETVGDRLTVQTLTSSNKDSTMKLRSSVDRRLAQKRQSRVIKMLAILVAEFFVCWTPLHTINLISLYKPKIVYQALGKIFFLNVLRTLKVLSLINHFKL